MKTNNAIATRTIIAAIALMIGGTVIAQQTPISNFYNFNEYLLNPSEAGANNLIEGTASHRIQWQGIEGAPTSTFFGLHGTLNDKMGIGAKVSVDQTDILKQFNAALSYAYRIKINEKTNLSFGVSGMMVQNSVGYADAVVGDLADEVVNGGTENGIAFDAEVGILLQYQKLNVGVVSSNLFETGVGYELPDDRGEGTFERVRQFSAYTSYKFGLSDNWTMEPFVLVRNQGVESFQFEVNALTTWKETLHLGVGYRQEAGLIGRVGFQITDQIVAAYAYEMGTTGVASYSSGSHEFMLGYKLARRNKDFKKELAPKITDKKEGNNTESINSAATKVALDSSEKIIEETSTGELQISMVSEKTEKKRMGVNSDLNEEIERKELISDNVIAAFDGDIKFEFASGSKEGSTISENEDLDLIATFLKQNKNQRILIKGHTCNRGSDEVNTFYSNKRANTVKNYLLARGINEIQMETKAVLDREPKVPNNSEENRKQNRRVTIELVD